MAGAACKLLLCRSRFAGETSTAVGIASLSGMTAPNLDALILEKLGGQKAFDALVEALGGGIEAMQKVNKILMSQ